MNPGYERRMDDAHRRHEEGYPIREFVEIQPTNRHDDLGFLKVLYIFLYLCFTMIIGIFVHDNISSIARDTKRAADALEQLAVKNNK